MGGPLRAPEPEYVDEYVYSGTVLEDTIIDGYDVSGSRK